MIFQLWGQMLIEMIRTQNSVMLQGSTIGKMEWERCVGGSKSGVSNSSLGAPQCSWSTAVYAGI